MEWISVNDSLPENNSRVLVCISDTFAKVMPYKAVDILIYNNGGFFDDELFVCEKVSHWMPLPEPPKE